MLLNFGQRSERRINSVKSVDTLSFADLGILRGGIEYKKDFIKLNNKLTKLAKLNKMKS